MILREAQTSGTKQIQVVRHSVKENVLFDPASVSDEDCKDYLTVRGKGWVCEVNNQILGFAIADLRNHNISALFIRPENERTGNWENTT